MSDPISDILNLSQAVSGFAQSAVQLQQARVSAEADRRMVGLNQLRQDFLAQADLAWDDPRRLKSDNWTEKFDEYKAAIDGYLGEVRDPAIEEKVRAAFDSSETQFQIAFSERMGAVALQEAQESGESALVGSLDSGDYQNALNLFGKYKEMQLFSPAKLDELETKYMMPAFAWRDSNSLLASSVTTTKLEDGTEIQSTVSPARAIEMAKAKPTGSAVYDEMVISNLEKIQKQYDDFYTGQMEEVFRKRSELGEVQSSVEMHKLLDSAGDMISQDARASLVTTIAGIEAQNSIQGVEAMGTTFAAQFYGKSVSFAQGMQMIYTLKDKFWSESGNTDVLEKVAEWEQRIRAWMPSGEASEGEKRDAFNAIWNNLITLYRAKAYDQSGQVVTGAKLMSVLTTYGAGMLSRSEFDTIQRQLLEGGFQDDNIYKAIGTEGTKYLAGVMKEFTESAGVADKRAKDALTAFLSGKKPDDYDVQFMSDIFESVRISVASGEKLTQEQFAQLVIDKTVAAFALVKDGAFEPPKLGAGDPVKAQAKYDSALNSVWKLYDEGKLDFLAPTDIMGVARKGSALSPVVDLVVEEARKLILATPEGKKFPLGTGNLSPIMIGGDLFFMVTGDPVGGFQPWKQTVWGVDPGSDRLQVRQYTVDTRGAPGIVDAIKRGGKSVLRLSGAAGTFVAAATPVSTVGRTPEQAADDALRQRIASMDGGVGIPRGYTLATWKALPQSEKEAIAKGLMEGGK